MGQKRPGVLAAYQQGEMFRRNVGFLKEGKNCSPWACRDDAEAILLRQLLQHMRNACDRRQLRNRWVAAQGVEPRDLIINLAAWFETSALADDKVDRSLKPHHQPANIMGAPVK